jgi:hypothetical protein
VSPEAGRPFRPGSRVVAVLVTGSVSAAAPAGIEPAAFARALVEDTADLVAGLELVTPAVAVSPAGEAALAGTGVEELVWPGTPVIRLTGDGGPGPAVQALAALAEMGASQAAILAADAPDLPPLLIGKLLRALGSERRADVAICPAEGGGLVALAAWLPPPGWLAGLPTGRDAAQLGAAALDAAELEGAALEGAELDAADIAQRLRGAAPTRGAVRNAPGWHRMRSPADVVRLDPGLEGWEATRELLFARGSRP